jgi:hypothetical protein
MGGFFRIGNQWPPFCFWMANHAAPDRCTVTTVRPEAVALVEYMPSHIVTDRQQFGCVSTQTTEGLATAGTSSVIVCVAADCPNAVARIRPIIVSLLSVVCDPGMMFAPRLDLL